PRHGGDGVLGERPDDLLVRRVLPDRDDVPGHHVLDGEAHRPGPPVSACLPMPHGAPPEIAPPESLVPLKVSAMPSSGASTWWSDGIADTFTPHSGRTPAGPGCTGEPARASARASLRRPSPRTPPSTPRTSRSSSGARLRRPSRPVRVTTPSQTVTCTV